MDARAGVEATNAAALEKFDAAATLDPDNARIGRAAAEVTRASALRDEIMEIHGR